MTRLLEIVAAAPTRMPMFASHDGPVTAGRIRSTATAIATRISGAPKIYLHTSSASLFVAGLLAAARTGATVCCPAHLQPLYLDEIGARDAAVVSDSAEHGAIAHAHLEQDCDGSMPADLDLVFFTSGSTGAPKTVRKAMRQLDLEAATLEQVWPGAARNVVSTVSHQHIYGMLFRIFWPLASGGVSSNLPAEYWEQLAGRLDPGMTLVSGPAHLTRLPPMQGANPGYIFSSGAPLPFEAAQRSRDVLGSLPCEVLGSTETGGIGWRQQETQDALWTPLPSVDVSLDGDGFVRVRSPFTDAGGEFKTGDLGELVDGKFRLKGRGDRVAKIDGKRVSLTRVEETLLASPLVAAAAAIDLPERRGALGAIVELTEEGRRRIEEKGAFRLSREMRRMLTQRLEPAERPKHWRFQPIPLDRLGKRLQSTLRAAFDTIEHENPSPGALERSDERSAEIGIVLAPDMIWFQGHFPEQPVLPGIAQVHLAVQWAERVWNWRPAGANLSQLKFRRVLRPGESVRLHLERLASSDRLRFAYHLGSVIASEGTIGGVA